MKFIRMANGNRHSIIADAVVFYKKHKNIGITFEEVCRLYDLYISSEELSSIEIIHEDLFSEYPVFQTKI